MYSKAVRKLFLPTCAHTACSANLHFYHCISLRKNSAWRLGSQEEKISCHKLHVLLLLLILSLSSVPTLVLFCVGLSGKETSPSLVITNPKCNISNYRLGAPDH